MDPQVMNECPSLDGPRAGAESGARAALARDDQQVAALRQTLEEQTEHLDALAARIEFMAGREAELRALFLHAQQQLERREDEVRALEAQLERQTLQDVAERDAIIRELQAKLREQTAWSQRSAEAVAQRDAAIRELQAELGRIRESWPARLYRAVRRTLTLGRR